MDQDTNYVVNGQETERQWREGVRETLIDALDDFLTFGSLEDIHQMLMDREA